MPMLVSSHQKPENRRNNIKQKSNADETMVMITILHANKNPTYFKVRREATIISMFYI